jgi:hypothetical protein
MWTHLKKAGVASVVGLAAALAAAQLIRPERTNPAIDSARAIQAQLGTESRLVAVLDRSCGDCHSNGTVWARYTHIAPVSWVIVKGVTEGRKAMNFSEWGTYSPQDQRELLYASCQDASRGSMPMRPYLVLRPEARLSGGDVETICAASRRAEANTESKTQP